MKYVVYFTIANPPVLRSDRPHHPVEDMNPAKLEIPANAHSFQFCEAPEGTFKNDVLVNGDNTRTYSGKYFVDATFLTFAEAVKAYPAAVDAISEMQKSGASGIAVCRCGTLTTYATDDIIFTTQDN